MILSVKAWLHLLSTIVPYVGIGAFFTTIRTVLRQEWTSALRLLIASSTSMVCAVGTGMFLQEQKHAQMTCFAGVALAALVSHDLIRVVLNFGDQAARDKGFGGQLFASLMPGKPPAPDDPKAKPPNDPKVP